MSPFKVDFEKMEWQQVRPDVRQKIYCEGSRQIRLVEFETSDGAEHFFIPSGAAYKHRSVAISSGTQLLMVEDL